ncbi:MAG TPA: hypothetical protein ENH12_01890 [Proteobacteria bacterium]|nr:hypothetical protein [Pseudomonadota bacterium]
MGVGTDWGELEIECLKLLKKFDSPEDKGEIYATVAFIYSDKGYNPLAGDITGQLSKTIEYCKKALEYPLNVVTACQIYSSWADALQIKYRNTDGGKFATARRQIIIPCLEGLKLILDNKVPEKRQPPPPRC